MKMWKRTSGVPHRQRREGVGQPNASMVVLFGLDMVENNLLWNDLEILAR